MRVFVEDFVRMYVRVWVFVYVRGGLGMCLERLFVFFRFEGLVWVYLFGWEEVVFCFCLVF